MHTPPHLRLPGAATPVTCSAGATVADAVLPLPPSWRPGVAFDAESDGVLPAVEVAYELPRVPGALLAALRARGAPLSARDAARLVSAAPRVLHRLRLQLGHRLDTELSMSSICIAACFSTRPS